MKNRGFPLLELLCLVAIAAILIVFMSEFAKAADGREPGDPRIPTFMGSYSGTYNGPFTGATRTSPNGAGITLGVPSDNSMIDWKALHLKRVAEVAKTKLENIEFEFDESYIEEQYFVDLDEVALLLSNNPEVSLILAGYTDLVGSEEYNAYLSYLRALAVRVTLMERGVPSSRLECVALGEWYPIELVETRSRKNRRVQVEVRVEIPTYLY